MLGRNPDCNIWLNFRDDSTPDFTAPFAITAEYAHPLETLILGFGTIGGPIIWVGLTRNLHIITLLCWVSVRIIQSLESHSGYDYPWSLRRFLPFWAGADHHDYQFVFFGMPSFVGLYLTNMLFFL